MSPWAARPSAFQDDAEEGVPSPDSHHDMDMEGTLPEGATGYYATGQDSAFQFEPPRAPAHYGASRNSPGPADQYSGFHSGWGTSAGGLFLSISFTIQPAGIKLMSYTGCSVVHFVLRTKGEAPVPKSAHRLTYKYKAVPFDRCG